MFFDRLLAFDHVRHQIHIIASADVSRETPKQAYARALRDIEAIEKRLKAGLKPAQMKTKRHAGKLKIKTHTSRKQYMKAVEDGKEYIAAGDIFQVVLSQRMDFEPKADPFTIYRALRTVNPSPYMYFLSFGKNQVLGSSPEMLVRVTGRKLEYRPIAGTRPRGRDEAEDRQREQELRADEKELAEHVMLVDLGRNDIGRVSEYGTVKVRDLMFVERYSHVMHIVSAIEGELRKDLDALDAFAACFPAGTLDRRPESARDGDYRRVGTAAPRHLWRLRSLCGLCGEPGLLYRNTNFVDGWQESVFAGGSGNRRGLGSGDGT